MKLKIVEVKNFRCFDSLLIDLDEQLTVLVAKNGQGKSTVLDAIRIGLWPFVSGFDLARNPGNEAGNNINLDDVRMVRINRDSTIRYDEMLRQFPSQIALQGHFFTNISIPFIDRWIKGERFPTHGEKREIGLVWTRFRESEAKGAKTRTIFGEKTKTVFDASALHVHHIAIALQDHIRNPESFDTDLPIIGYYGTGRFWSQKRLTEKKKEHDASFYMRLFGYRDCLDPSSSYREFSNWFTWIFECYMEEKFKLSENFRLSESSLSGGSSLPKTDSVWSNIIQVVQQVINIVLEETGWYNLEYSVSHEKSLVLKHEEYGTLKVEQLSDGIRNVLGMVGDIAYRCIKLNPHLGLNAAKEARGIVLIDEVDMHLHPVWQQTILGGLTKAFPKIQFIVTTHSPQVISTVPAKQIRILDDNKVYSAEAGTQGAESSRILKRVFGVEPRPQNDPNAKLLNEYLDLVYADKWEEPDAKRDREKLDAIYQGNEPALTEADLYIENRQWELDIEKNQ